MVLCNQYILNKSLGDTVSHYLSLSLHFLGPQGYWLVLLGQFISSFSNLVFFGAGPLLSETWFPSSERATATALGGAIAPQLGILIAMGVTPVIIHSDLTEIVCNSSNTSVTATPEEVLTWSNQVNQLWLYYQSVVAGVAVLTFLLTLCGECVALCCTMALA